MDSYLGEIEQLIFTLVCLAGLGYLVYSSWKKKKLKISGFAQELDAQQIDSGVIGKYGSFEYILYIDEGHSGGAASGPTRAGYPSSMRIIIEKKGKNKFHINSNGKDNAIDKNGNYLKIQKAAQELFIFGFKEIDYDGNALDIKLYPYNLDSAISARNIKNILPTVSQIVEVL